MARRRANRGHALARRRSRARGAREHAKSARSRSRPRPAIGQDPYPRLDGARDSAHRGRQLRRVLRSGPGPRVRHGREPPRIERGRRGGDGSQGELAEPASCPAREPDFAGVRSESRAACDRAARTRRLMVFDPRQTVFVILSFEGPDVYSQAGGLGVRVKGLSRTLAQLGYETHLFFIGDPELPSEETHEHGRLHYHRWCQWLSAFHRGGVYDGEEDKLRDWERSVPPAVVDGIIAPAIESGRNVVVLAEEWQTAATMNLLSDSLYYRALRDRVVMLWNANNTFGFRRINWGALAFASTITTVSRYMKLRMWEWGQNPIVIPNGVPLSTGAGVDPAVAADVREAAAADHFCLKIGRFDPDKRWLMAMTAMAYLKQSGSRVRLLMRGGSEPHGLEVMLHARSHGLHVTDVKAPDDPAGLARVLRAHPHADVINVTSYINDDLLEVIY